MEPNSFGKKLGMGLRIAGNIARDRAKEAAQEAAKRSENTAAAANPRVAPVYASPAQVQQTLSRKAEEVAQKGRQVSQGIERGSRQFGRSFFGPLANAGSVLWMEITGCFFALFALFFAQNIYRVRAQYASGPEHRTFLLYCFLTAIFGYFSLSSFLRARRRSRKQAAGR